MSVRYRKVPQTDVDNHEVENKQKKEILSERITTKFHAALWVLFSIALAHWSNIWDKICCDERINRSITSFLKKPSTINLIC